MSHRIADPMFASWNTLGGGWGGGKSARRMSSNSWIRGWQIAGVRESVVNGITSEARSAHPVRLVRPVNPFCERETNRPLRKRPQAARPPSGVGPPGDVWFSHLCRHLLIRLLHRPDEPAGVAFGDNVSRPMSISSGGIQATLPSRQTAKGSPFCLCCKTASRTAAFMA